MIDQNAKPALRETVTAVPVQDVGGVRFLIRDAARISAREFMLTPELYHVVGLMTGEKSLAELAPEVSSTLGRSVTPEHLALVADDLDRAYLLETERFFKYYDREVEAFAALETRPASHAGLAYPDDPTGLGIFMDSFFTHEDGPGKIGAKMRSSCAGVVAPHIDLVRGGPVYAHAYKALAESGPMETVLVLGVNHGPSRNLFPSTLKGYETPFGTVKTDEEFLRAMNDNYSGDLLDDEYAHKSEHSIEFQAAFLARYLPGVKIVPVLVSGFQDILSRGESPEDFQLIESFVKGYHAAREKTGRSVALVAGVDFSHVGAKFGGEPLEEKDLGEVEKADRATLAALESGDARAFNENILSDDDARNVCGYPALYVFLRLLGGEFRGKTLAYSQAWEEPTRSVVSYAAAVFGA